MGGKEIFSFIKHRGDLSKTIHDMPAIKLDYIEEFGTGYLHLTRSYTRRREGDIKYEGECNTTGPHGQGTVIWDDLDETKWTGRFKDDLFCGRGTLTLPDGTTKEKVLKGRWNSKWVQKEIRRESS